MSKDVDDKGGYGKPPKNKQFKKGQSGNPKGRPKGSKNKRTIDDIILSPLGDLISQEVRRNISIQENGETIELSCIQAIIRSITIKALKNHHPSQKFLLEITEKVETEKLRKMMELAKYWIGIREIGIREIEYCEKHGLPEPKLIPHPDNIHIDMGTLEVSFSGPTSRFEQRTLECLIEHKANHMADLRELKKELLEAKSDEARESIQNSIRHTEDILKLFKNIPFNKCSKKHE